jgi:hypothetical protein
MKDDTTLLLSDLRLTVSLGDELQALAGALDGVTISSTVVSKPRAGSMWVNVTSMFEFHSPASDDRVQAHVTLYGSDRYDQHVYRIQIRTDGVCGHSHDPDDEFGRGVSRVRSAWMAAVADWKDKAAALRSDIVDTNSALNVTVGK